MAIGMNGKLYLFGTLKLSQCDPTEQFLDVGSPKTQALLAYCALHHDEPIERRRLAFMLWSRTTESAARRNLRQYLHRVRQVLAPLGLDAQLQDVSGSHLLFSPGDDFRIDVDVFRQCVETVIGQLPSAKVLPPEAWQAVALYQGDLVPAVYDDWVEPLRTHWRQQFTDFLHALIDFSQQHHAHADAIQLAKRLLQLDPLRESSHRVLMESYYLSGDRVAALQQFEQCQQQLRAELDADPMPETLLLYQKIRQGEKIARDAAPNAAVTTSPPTMPAKPTAWQTLKIVPAGIETNQPPFIARQTEINRIDQTLRRIQQNQGQLVFVHGESGVGKTRLVQEWLTANADSIRLITGQAREFETMISYHPLVDALQNSVAYLYPFSADPPLWWESVLTINPDLATLSPQFQPTFRGELNRQHLLEGLGRCFISIAEAEPTPLVIFLEDLHWADEATWQFLAHIGWRCRQSPLMVIGTFQQEYLSSTAQKIRRGIQRQLKEMPVIELTRFSPEETRRLASFLLDDPNPQRHLLSRLFRETEGNPFFIIEMVGAWFNTRANERRRRSKKPDIVSTYSMPASIKLVIETRLNRLDDESRALLAMAAAIGRTFNYRVLTAASNLPEEDIIRVLEVWLAQGLVVERANGYDFSHDKIREVAYRELSRARRRMVHRQIALALERDNTIGFHHPAVLAHHFSHSDQPQRALPYLIEAGEKALSVRSYGDAREFGVQAMRLLRAEAGHGEHHRQARVDLNLQLATAYAFTGEIDRALPILQEAERLAMTAGDDVRLGKIFRRSGQLFWLRNQCRLAEDYGRRLLRNAEEQNNPILLHAALRMLGRVGIALGTYDDAIAYLLRYVKLDDSINPPPDLPAIYGYLAVAYARVGAWQRGFDAARRGVELAESAGNDSAIAMAKMNLAFVYAERRHWAGCLDAVQQIIPTCTDAVFSSYCFMAQSLRGRALAHLGQPAEGAAIIRKTLQQAADANYRLFTHISYLFLVETLVLANEPHQALQTLARAESIIAEADDRWAKAVAARLRAEALALMPEPDWTTVESQLIDAAGLLRQIRARPDLARVYLILRRLYDRAGQSAWAIDCHFRATTIFEELGMFDELQHAQGDATTERGDSATIPIASLRGLVRQE